MRDTHKTYSNVHMQEKLCEHNNQENNLSNNKNRPSS